MKLYYHPLSPYSRKVLVALHEKHIDFEPHIVNLLDPGQKASYCSELNPFGKLPCAVVADGWKIPDATIIIEYIDASYDKPPRLIPEDKHLARHARFFDRIGDFYLIEPATTLFAEERRPAAERDEDKIGEARAHIALSLTLWNDHLARCKYAVDDDFSLGDIAASAGIHALTRMGQKLGEHPNVKAWFERVIERPSWQRVIAELEPHLAAL